MYNITRVHAEYMYDITGVHDVSWNNIQAPTPNLGSLAKQGVILDNIYSLPVCTPSRAALLTATYPFRYGLQVRLHFWILEDK